MENQEGIYSQMYINVIKFGIYSIKLYGKRNIILSAYQITLY